MIRSCGMGIRWDCQEEYGERQLKLMRIWGVVWNPKIVEICMNIYLISIVNVMTYNPTYSFFIMKYKISWK